MVQLTIPKTSISLEAARALVRAAIDQSEIQGKRNAIAVVDSAGDLIFTAMAFRLARRTGRSDVTAMPLGLDTPSTFGAVYLIMGPAFLAARGRGLEPLTAAEHAWFLGIAMILEAA